MIQKFFDAGNVTIYGDKAMYQITKVNDLLKVITHFDTYSLKTKKYSDYILFKQALKIVTDKNHLIQSGFLSILSIRSAINNGMSDRLKAYFPNIVPAIKLSTPILNINSNMSELKF